MKGLMGKFRGPLDKSPDLLNPMYGINGPAVEHTGGDQFDNATYAMQTVQENIQSGNITTGGYDYAKPLPRKKDGGLANENTSKTAGDSSVSNYHPQYEEVGLKKSCDLYDTTYQTLSGERCIASYDYIMGSNAEIMTSPHARLGETAYDNAAI
ncbi:hypothetical protein CHS0354_013526 [Potamilus streckersoni]|uniref:Uncharacterized protein n=1 Tax=Potamilus streckersoni TaxID=2493646 RepID=A0AAE0T8D2_9BIVA|nr:hypothetical protein CHS0354_013526 [Potamilus streckersoni]